MKSYLLCMPVFFVLALIFATPVWAQQLRITAPTDGLMVMPGQQVDVTVEADPFAGGITLSTSSDVITIRQGDKHGAFILEIPPTLSSGSYSVMAEAENGEAANIKINVENKRKPYSLLVTPDTVRFDQIGQRVALKVSGVFADGSKTDLSSSFNTSFTVFDAEIAEINKTGEVTAKALGETEVKISHAGLSISVPVQVVLENNKQVPLPQPIADNSGGKDDNRNWPAQPKNICRLDGAGYGFAACPFPVWHANTFDSYDMNTGYAYAALVETNYQGARSDPGEAQIPIHAFDKCYYVDNNTKKSFFIPFKTDEEWTAFIRNHPPGTTLRPCTAHGVYTSKSATSKGDQAVFSLPAYMSGGDVESYSQSFGYYEPKRCNAAKQCFGPWEWKETITARFQASPPQWRVLDETVIGEPPNIPDVDQ